MVSRKQGKESIVKNGSLFRGSVASVSALVLIFPALSLGGPTTTIQPPAARTSATSRPPAENAADRAGEPLAPFDRVEVGLTPELSRDAAARRPAVYGKLPLIFEANRGQTDSRVKFLSRGNGYTLFLTATETVLALAGRRSSAAGNRFRGPRPDATMPAETESGLVRMQFIGANPEPSVTGLEELPGKANYFIGRDPTKWRTNVPTYARVEYRDIYPGVNLVYFGDQRQLEYDFVVRPGASPEAITLGFQGADKLEVDAQGDLVLHTAVGAIRQRRPFVYQEVGGARREIAGGYVLRGAGRVGFQVAAYDRSQPLVIDPVLSYATYLGGSRNDNAFGIAVDASGNAYVTGYTVSTDFPTTAGAFQPTFGGGIEHAFVTKLNPTSFAVAYSTFLGGSFAEQGTGIVVDASGNAYVAVRTESTDFPTTAGAFQPTFGGSEDAAVTELNPSGSALVYSAYLGGSNSDVAYGIAVDASGDAYVAGITASANFPTTAGAFQTTRGGGDFDAFVAKVSPNTPTGTNVSVSAGNGVTVTFTAVASPGETAAPTSSTGPTPPAGFTVGTPPTYYNIQTTATYGPPVSVCITYNPAQFGDPSTLHLFHCENNAWVDLTTSIDTSKHVICGTVNSLSPFAIFQKLPPPTDMAISKGGPSRVSSGSNLTYGIGVVNLGPNTASGVVVTDRVPAGTSFVSAQFAKGSCTVSGGTVSCTMSQPGTPCAFSNGTVTCDIGTLSPYTPANPAGAGVQLVVNVTAPRGATITNTATVSASNPDPNQANDSSTATTSVR